MSASTNNWASEWLIRKPQQPFSTLFAKNRQTKMYLKKLRRKATKFANLLFDVNHASGPKRSVCLKRGVFKTKTGVVFLSYFEMPQSKNLIKTFEKFLKVLQTKFFYYLWIQCTASFFFLTRWIQNIWVHFWLFHSWNCEKKWGFMFSQEFSKKNFRTLRDQRVSIHHWMKVIKINN